MDFIFCFESTGESAFRWSAGLGMSRVLLFGACEGDRTWQSLPSGLGKGNNEVCALERVCAGRDGCWKVCCGGYFLNHPINS